ncbi:YgaP family membrane protein [Neobacillus drentensis]|uniref:YgaP family membrane protein n=1 Tax=Neobacillus drentensis TaxID=220684 RepID=UPI002FFFA80E
MNVKPNISMINALIRITLGLTILSWTTSKLVKQPWRDSYLFVALCGAMKVAEGIVRFCPLTALFEKYQCMITEHDHAMDSRDSMEGLNDHKGEEILPYNPT